MKHSMLIIWLVLALSSVASACKECDAFWKEYYKHKTAEQKYRYPYLNRESNLQHKLAMKRARQWQRLRRRYYGRSYYHRMPYRRYYYRR